MIYNSLYFSCQVAYIRLLIHYKPMGISYITLKIYKLVYNKIISTYITSYLYCNHGIISNNLYFSCHIRLCILVYSSAYFDAYIILLINICFILKLYVNCN